MIVKLDQGNTLSVIERFDNLAPILDFVLVDVDKRGQVRIFTPIQCLLFNSRIKSFVAQVDTLKGQLRWYVMESVLKKSLNWKLEG